MTTGLLLIDVQKAILKGLGSTERQPLIDKALDETVARLAEVLRKARAVNAPVFIVQHDGQASHRLAEGSDGWLLRDEIAPQDRDIVIHKRSCDSFFETGLQTCLKENGITRLVVGGCMTQFCIDTTARRAVSLGYDVTLMSDGHMTADMGDLGFQQIIAHHNAVLDEFDAGSHEIRLAEAAAINFG
ncbi:isochorismatase-like protein [Rhizobium etli 8C-3]|uniref:Nicotinamidase-related amidase n=2 Tax=Rhizobium TaxID=379 RepID=A0A4R3QW61_9HYPH|nr:MULTISPECIES: cysteine hydrolase family protein [Rhizobium]APO73206.1 isochorismatase-like protein [Rhizobium etli 8C-3]TCU26690.1 nicotinamidase-related amidase [Rhizobium azibense]TCU38604.1 nicotinamidase-related amidase [Rhizobium azibense]